MDQWTKEYAYVSSGQTLLLGTTVRDANLNGGALGPLVHQVYVLDIADVNSKLAWATAWSKA